MNRQCIIYLPNGFIAIPETKGTIKAKEGDEAQRDEIIRLVSPFVDLSYDDIKRAIQWDRTELLDSSQLKQAS